MTRKPRRIQLSRRKGWRKPPGAVVCSRPSKWGNPFRAGEAWEGIIYISDPLMAVRYFASWIDLNPKGRAVAAAARRELRGKDLCCWCALGKPCHVDVLLRIANAPQGGGR